MRHPTLLATVSSLLGPNVLCWLTSFFIKDARDGQFVSWHQDANYWGLDGVDGVVSAWVALTPSTQRNGCMRMIPGSHKEKLVHRETGHASNMLSRGQTTEIDDSNAVDIVLKPGEACLFHPYLVHGSNPNESEGRRIGFAMRYIVPERVQTKSEHDSAALVLGRDDFHHFEHEPRPAFDLAPDALTLQERILTHKHGGVYLRMRERG